jgi:gliding motility-associated-like protein
MVVPLFQTAKKHKFMDQILVAVNDNSIMKRLLSVFVIIFFIHNVYSQKWIYSSVIKGDNISPSQSILDNQDNFIILSTFQSSIYSIGYNSLGSSDIAIFKIDATGNLLWSKQIGSTGNDGVGGVAVDNDNNIYVLGNYAGLCQFTPSQLLSNNGDLDIFIAKYDPSGNLIWAKALASTQNIQAINNVKYDNGRLIICGYFKQNITLGVNPANSITLDGNSYNSGFISLIDTVGNPIWAKRVLGNHDASKLIGIGICNDGYIFGGHFTNSMYFDIDTLLSQTENLADAFLYKTSKIGDGIWIRKLSGIGTDNLRSVSIDDANYIYAIGNFNAAEILVDSSNSSAIIHKGNSANYNIFVCKYDYSGVLQWIKSYGNGYNIYASDIFSRNNTVFTTGYFINRLIFLNDTINTSSNTNGDPYLAAFTDNGLPLSAISIKGIGNYYDSGNKVVINSDSKAYITGYYNSQSIYIGQQNYTSSNINKPDQFFAVYKHPLMPIVKEQKDPGCYGGNDGVLELETYFGKPPYSYSWSHNRALNTSRLTNLAAGTYDITITDANGEDTTVTKTLTQPAPVGFSAIITSVQCYGDSTGAADVTVLNASGTPTFDWSTGATTEDETDLKAGTYTLTVTDSIGCTAFGVITVDEPDPMGLVVTKDAANLCYGDSIASLTANPSGGMGLFSYQWNDALYQTDQTATGLGQGSYAVLVTDANGCTLSDTTVITQPDSISLDIVTTDPTCAGLSNGSAIPTVSGGTPQYDYAWSNGVFERFNTDIPAGDFTLTVTDGNNCIKTALVTLGEPAALVLDAITPQDASCFGYEDGSLEISASGGTGTLQYSIDGTNEFMSPLFDSLAAGTYTIRVTDSLDCAAETTADVGQPEGMALTLSLAGDISCHGDSTASIAAAVTGGAGTLTYFWDDATAQTGDTAINLAAGDYSLQVTDSSGCMVTAGLAVTEPESIAFDTTAVVQISETNPTGAVSLEASGGTGSFTFMMLPDSTSDATGIFDELAAGDYTFFATDVNGCTSVQLAVTITDWETPPETGLQFYDAFSPNGDGKNDVWHIRNIEQYPDCVVKIFNSWGTPVFSSKGYGTPWDGKSGGKELPSGTYYYLVDPGDGSPSRTGPVSLVK